MEPSLLNIGFGSTVVAHRIVSIVSPNSAPMKRLKDEAKDDKRLIDATHGRRTRSIIIMDSNHIVLYEADLLRLLRLGAMGATVDWPGRALEIVRKHAKGPGRARRVRRGP